MHVVQLVDIVQFLTFIFILEFKRINNGVLTSLSYPRTSRTTYFFRISSVSSTSYIDHSSPITVHSTVPILRLVTVHFSSSSFSPRILIGFPRPPCLVVVFPFLPSVLSLLWSLVSQRYEKDKNPLHFTFHLWHARTHAHDVICMCFF